MLGGLISGVVARWEMLGFSKNPTFTFSFYFQFFLTFDLVVLLPVFLPASILEPLPPLVLDLVIRISLLAPNENILLESFSVQTGGDSWVFEITPWRFSFWSSGLRVFLGTFVAFKISVKGASLFAELERTFKILSERVTLSSILNLHCFRLWWKTAFPRNKLSLNQQYRNTHNYRNIPKETKIYRIAPKYTKQRRYIQIGEVSLAISSTTNSRTAHLKVVWGRHDADKEKHRQISHGLTGAQRVSVGDSNQLTLTNRVSERSVARWPLKEPLGLKKDRMLAAGVTTRRRCPLPDEKVGRSFWFP